MWSWLGSPKGWQQSSAGVLAATLARWLLSQRLTLPRWGSMDYFGGGDIKQENVATDLVGFYRELTQCVGAGMTQKVPVGRLDGWAWRLALCAEQKQGSM